MNLLLLISLLSYTSGAVLNALRCKRANILLFEFERPLIDVALDEELKVLKFFFNSKIVGNNNLDDQPVINDVNYTTNKYTTFHAQLWFLDEVVVDENKRFCDMAGVKMAGPRAKRDEVHEFETSFAHSNNSIENLFANPIPCPFYANDSVYFYYQIDVADYLSRMGTFTARFAIIDNDFNSTVRMCTRVYITRAILLSIRNGILITVLVLLLVAALINFLTIIYSSYQESRNPFLFNASAICNEELLRQLDATAHRMILYLQFALFTAGLNINYPGFYQPVLALLKWCALLGFKLLPGNEFLSSIVQDNIYLTYNADGLNSLSYFGSYRTLGDNWLNFILTLIIWIVIQVMFQIGVFILRSIRHISLKKPVFNKETRSNIIRGLLFVTGVALNNFMSLFGFPFLVLTLYMMYVSTEDHAWFYPNVASVKDTAFLMNVTYDELFSPLDYYKDTSGQVDGQSRFSFDYMTPQDRRAFKNGFNGVGTAPLAVSAILFALWLVIAFYFVFRYLVTIKHWRFRMNMRVTKLYTSVNTLLVWSFFYYEYHPSKNYYVMIDLALMVVKLLVVSLIQNSGLAQVVALIVIEFGSLFLLFLCRPFYLSMNWTTTRWMIPFAKLLVTILCIPFIDELNLSESSRTYVAFTQILIHLVIALAFVGQMVYCLVITLRSIIKHEKKYIPANKPTDDMDDSFEFKPITPSGSIPEREMITDPEFPKDAASSDVSYYRESNWLDSGYQTQDFQTDMEDNMEKDLFTLFNIKNTHHDYTTRESDRIYKKYFVDDEIDQDVKELWESRNKRNGSSELKKAPFSRLSIKKKKGTFEVSRPKQLIVRTLDADSSNNGSNKQ